MICWKVVNYKFKSCIVDGTQYALTYNIGKITKARKNTIGVMCFKHKAQACYFAKTLANVRLLKCERINRKRLPCKIAWVHIVNTEDAIPNENKSLDKYYRRKWDGRPSKPKGTILFEAIKPIKEVT